MHRISAARDVPCAAPRRHPRHLSIHLLPLLILIPFAFAPLAPASAATIHVPAGQPTIQAGLEAAGAGDSVVVSCGTYHEHDLSMPSGVVLRSESGTPDCVVIDAQGLGRGISLNNCSSLTRIEGLTVTGGHATGGYPSGVGGGLSCVDSSPSIAHCNFTANTAYLRGGGMAIELHASPTVERCTFTDNAADWGGGMAISFYGTATIANCEFRGNDADRWGGAIEVQNATPVVHDCRMTDNSAGLSGGAIATFVGGHASLTSCLLDENAAQKGGAIYINDAATSLLHCTLYGNTASHLGSSACLEEEAAFTALSSILSFGDAESIVCDGSSSADLGCCDVYGHAGGDWVGCIASQQGIDGNFGAPPGFCAPDLGNFGLMEGSPCLPGNHPHGTNCGPIGAFGPGCTTTAIQPVHTTWGRLKTMFR